MAFEHIGWFIGERVLFEGMKQRYRQAGTFPGSAPYFEMGLSTAFAIAWQTSSWRLQWAATYTRNKYLVSNAGKRRESWSVNYSGARDQTRALDLSAAVPKGMLYNNAKVLDFSSTRDAPSGANRELTGVVHAGVPGWTRTGDYIREDYNDATEVWDITTDESFSDTVAAGSTPLDAVYCVLDYRDVRGGGAGVYRMRLLTQPSAESGRVWFGVDFDSPGVTLDTTHPSAGALTMAGSATSIPLHTSRALLNDLTADDSDVETFVVSMTLTPL